MADALRSGRSALKGVRVQVPPSAQKIEYVRVTGKYTERSEGLFGVAMRLWLSWIERSPAEAEVAGSNPARRTILGG